MCPELLLRSKVNFYFMLEGSHSAPDPTDLPQCVRPAELSETNSFQNWLIVLLCRVSGIIYPVDRDKEIDIRIIFPRFNVTR